jgi:MFS family permease
VGTLLFAVFTVSDRFSPRVVFFICALLGALSNTGMLLSSDLTSLIILRFITGFFLAGIYPVGMKIAASWYQKGLGRALGYLVGALVLGTAFPHLLNTIGHTFSWKDLIPWTSIVAATGGLLLFLLVPDGPYLSRESKFNPRVIYIIFKSADFRSAALGYFGHMWELYTLWAFIPVFLSLYATHHAVQLNISFWSFCIIAAGTIGCVLGGLISVRTGSAPVAWIQLLTSGICCILSPLVFFLPKVAFLFFLLIWGITVAGDSPQFSTLNAKTAPQDYVGSALTIVTSIGFFITIISIQLESVLIRVLNPNFIFAMLVIGPVFGLWKLRRILHSTVK